MANKKMVEDCGGLKPYISADLKKAMKENSKKSNTIKVKKPKKNKK